MKTTLLSVPNAVQTLTLNYPRRNMDIPHFKITFYHNKAIRVVDTNSQFTAYKSNSDSYKP